jgi:hypothetical protein
LTLDETELNDTSGKQTEDEDVEMKEEVPVPVKQEAPEDFKKPETSGAADDDDDVIVLPTEEPVVTEILDESEIQAKNDLNVTDDDVVIQEPKIETQLVPDDDDDDYQPSSTSNELPFIVKIKEEPKDDGYEEVGNDDEDPFVEVTAIANDDLNGESTFSPLETLGKRQKLEFPVQLHRRRLHQLPQSSIPAGARRERAVRRFVAADAAVATKPRRAFARL